MRDGKLFAAALCRRGRRAPQLWLIVGAVFSSLLFPQPAHSQETQNSLLHGTVINSVTREPIAHALVFSADSRFAAFTDDQGHFEFQLAAAGSSPNRAADGQAFYTNSILTARKPGFLGSTDLWSSLPRSAPDGIAITLVPESLIIGRVNLPSSNQFDRISVSAYKRGVRDGRPTWVPAATVSTRSNGEFRIADLAAGTYKIFTNELLDRDPITFDPRGQLYGYPPTYYPGAVDLDSASAVTLEAGKTLQIELAPVLRPYYPVKIAVTDSLFSNSAEVLVELQGHKGPGYSLEYTGRDVEGMLPNGTYNVEVSMSQGPKSAAGSVNITVRDAPLTASMVVLQNGSIPVHIKDESNSNSNSSGVAVIYGNARARELRANIWLQPADDVDSRGSISLRSPLKPDDNDLVLDNARPGRYWLKVDPHRGYVAAAVAGTVDLLRQPLVIGPGGASLPIELVLRDDGASIEGTIDDVPPTPAGGGRAGPVPGGRYVYCIPLPDSPGRFMTSLVTPTGTFQFQQLPPGAYRILAFDRQQDELEYANAEAMVAYEGKGAVVRLVAGQTEQVRVTLISTKE